MSDQDTKRQKLYEGFLNFIREDAQMQRRSFQKRMFHVFLWCFVLPVLTVVVFLLLIYLQVLPVSVRFVLDWAFLAFPVFYSIYFLSAEVLRELPGAFRQGGISLALQNSRKQNEWRVEAIRRLRSQVRAEPEDWDWIAESFRMDLQAIRIRTKHLTVLAGAVFFLLMQGIDSIVDGGKTVVMTKHGGPGLIELATNQNFGQYVGLALFLVLLYLSGIQTFHAFEKYLGLAELQGLD